MSVAPDTPEEVLSDLGRGLKAIRDKRDVYGMREDYYLGKRREVITHPKLERLLNKYGDAFRLNYAAVPVDALADRVDLQGLTAGEEGTDQVLRERLWEPNSLEDDADDYHLHAFYLGDFYVIAELITDDAGNVDTAADATDDESGTGVGTVELTPKDPFSTVIVYQRSNSRIPDFGVQLVEGDGEGDYDAFVYYDDTTWTFTTKPGTSKDGYWKADAWVLDLDEDAEGNPEPIVNEVGLFPVFHFRPDGKPYGRPINAKMYGPQDAITKIQATQMGAMDYYGFPQRYATVNPDADDDDDMDDDFSDEGTEAPGRTGGGSKLSSDPGGVWMLRGVKDVGQFQPADPKGFLDPLAFQIRAGATLSRTPLYEFDLEGGGDAPSGEARRRADAPITKHADKVKGQFSAVWAAIGAYTLTALGLGAGKKVAAVWSPSETATDNEGMALVALKIKNGLPPRQALLEAGYTQDQVDKWLPVDEANGLAMPLTPDMVVQLAGALQQIGQAKTLGAINDDQVRRVFALYFGVTTAPEPDPLAELDDIPVDETADLPAKATALGQLVRAGVKQEDAARLLGLSGITFDGTPVALRDDTATVGQ